MVWIESVLSLRYHAANVAVSAMLNTIPTFDAHCRHAGDGSCSCQASVPSCRSSAVASDPTSTQRPSSYTAVIAPTNETWVSSLGT